MATPEYEAVPEITSEAAQPHLGTVVMKFGGSSVADTARLKAVAGRIVAAREAGSRVVAVLSAMGDTTDDLIALAYETSPRPHPRELDMLISVGERISCALAAMAIHDLGHEAISLTGSQAGIVTDTAHGKAKIVDIRAMRIHEALDEDKIVLVAGFQGVSTGKEMISGVTHTLEEAVYRVENVTLERLFGTLAEAGVNVDTIVQTGGEIVFSAPVEDGEATAAALDSLGVTWSSRADLGKVSLIGAGMKSHPGVAARFFAVLAEEGIEPQVVSTSPIKISSN